MLEALVADFRAHNNHVTAGDVGFHYVVDALLEGGRSDVLYDMLERTDTPSYGYQLAKGATALTEAWDADPNSSQDHFMLGHAEEWFYRGLGGINVDLSAEAAATGASRRFPSSSCRAKLRDGPISQGGQGLIFRSKMTPASGRCGSGSSARRPSGLGPARGELMARNRRRAQAAFRPRRDASNGAPGGNSNVTTSSATSASSGMLPNWASTAVLKFADPEFADQGSKRA